MFEYSDDLLTSVWAGDDEAGETYRDVTLSRTDGELDSISYELPLRGRTYEESCEREDEWLVCSPGYDRFIGIRADMEASLRVSG